jgi:hypothetical protein
MRATRRIATILLCLVLLAGCIVAPTTTAAPTAGPTATSTPTVTPAPTSAPLLVLPSEVMPFVGIRVDYDDLLKVAGIEEGYPYKQFIVDFDLSGGGRVHFELEDDGWLSRVIARYQVEGQPLVEPTPDASPVADSRFVHGTLSFDLGDELQASNLTSALGTPTSDETVVRDVLDEGSFRFRTLTFARKSFTLAQRSDAADKATWTLDGYSITDPAFATARGLKLGLSAEDVVRLFSGKVFGISIEGTKAGLTRVSVLKDGKYIGVEFTADRATRLDFFTYHGD